MKDPLYQARVLMDVQVALRDNGHTSVALGSEESSALIEGNKLLKDEGLKARLALMLDNGVVALSRGDLDAVYKCKALLAEKGGQPLTLDVNGLPLKGATHD